MGRGLLGGRQPLRDDGPDRAQGDVRVAAPNIKSHALIKHVQYFLYYTPYHSHILFT